MSTVSSEHSVSIAPFSPVATTEQELVAARQQIAHLTKQLQHAQRLTALGDLVGTTTHEFNNVLTTVINYAKLGLRHADNPTREKALTKILEAGQRAARLTNGVLGFARNRTSEFEPTDLHKVIEDVLVLLERELQKYKIRLDLQLEPTTPAVWANGNQIQQVLLNLVVNARQAMPQGGQLVLRLAPAQEPGYVDIFVRDTGCGMPPETLRRIFDPYFTTKSGPDATGKGGTGLGLSLCKDIIEAHHGRIRVESSVGKGTAFTLKLPVASGKIS
ncbi:MAG: ATP-binding protein [Pirellulales bacterium]|nr:ATP-binding protein [Pirellulales bacterium]